MRGFAPPVRASRPDQAVRRRIARQRCRVSLEDEPGPWIAWRVWAVIDVDGEPRLGSPCFPAFGARVAAARARDDWPVGEPTGQLLLPGEAQNPRIWGPGAHACVTEEGVRANRILFEDREPGAGGDCFVLGTVALWGRRLQAQPGTQELRFEFGYPVELHGIDDFRAVGDASTAELRAQLRKTYRLDKGSGLESALQVSATRLRDDLRARHGDTAEGWAHLPGAHAPRVESASPVGGRVEMDALLTALERHPADTSSSLHGLAHGRQVATFAVALAQETPGADPLVALLFGLLHDSPRRSEGHDPAHGDRAAELGEWLNGGAFELRDGQTRRLTFALQLHAEGLLSAEPTIGCCWDADRLALWRLDRRPAPALLSTAAGRERILWAREQTISTWADLAELASRACRHQEPRPIHSPPPS